MPNPAPRTAGRRRFAISTPPEEEPDIFHSPLLTSDTIVPAFQRYIRATTLSRPQRKARAPHPGRVRFEGSRMGFPTRSSRYALRELLLLVIAAAASFVFINHDNLYLTHAFRLADARIESYLLASIVIYLFLRVAIIGLELAPSDPADGL